MINLASGNSIHMISRAVRTGAEIARRDAVEGYEFRKDQYRLLSESDLDGVKVQSPSLRLSRSSST